MVKTLYRYLVERGRGILIAFPHDFGYYIFIYTQVYFLKFSCSVKFGAVSINFSYCYVKIIDLACALSFLCMHDYEYHALVIWKILAHELFGLPTVGTFYHIVSKN